MASFCGRGGLDLSPLERAGRGENVRRVIRGQSHSAVFSLVRTFAQATPHLKWWGHPRDIQGALLALEGSEKDVGVYTRVVIYRCGYTSSWFTLSVGMLGLCTLLRSSGVSPLEGESA